MFSTKFIESKLIERFKNREVFHREDLLRFYQEFEPDLKEGTFGWRIYELKRKHIIRNVKKGAYTLEEKQKFKPELDKMIIKIGKLLESSFDHHAYNIWNTAWLNEMTELQITSFMIILEVDKDSMETVFFTLKDKGSFNNVYLKPDETVINTYISENSEPIIVKSMISRAPVTKIKKVIIPTIEKILVDLYCDEKLFFAFQGNQLIKIYASCLDKYIINYSRLLNYARRRKREEGIIEFLTTHLHDKIKEIIE
ncbi:MAG: DUF6577 family protein [Chitinophagaceae bacterium]